MADVSIAEAKAKLSDLVRDAEHGRATTITRRGRPVARIEPLAGAEARRKPLRSFDFERLRRHLESMPVSDIFGADLVRRMRDDED